MFLDVKNKLKKNFKDVKTIYLDYFKGYGGFHEIVTSVYFVIAVFINLFAYKAWIGNSWIDNIQNIIPDIVGFSLGVYAILISFGNDKFQTFITEKEENKLDKPDYSTMYLKLNTTFIHFILMQILALILSILGGSLLIEPYGILEIVFAFFCHLVFVYSLMLCVAAVFCVFRIARTYQEYKNYMKPDE